MERTVYGIALKDRVNFESLIYTDKEMVFHNIQMYCKWYIETYELPQQIYDKILNVIEIKDCPERCYINIRNKDENNQEGKIILFVKNDTILCNIAIYIDGVEHLYAVTTGMI